MVNLELHPRVEPKNNFFRGGPLWDGPSENVWSTMRRRITKWSLCEDSWARVHDCCVVHNTNRSLHFIQIYVYAIIIYWIYIVFTWCILSSFIVIDVAFTWYILSTFIVFEWKLNNWLHKWSRVVHGIAT